jgi:hypothetical protein
VAYHGGQETGSVSVGNSAKGGGISEKLVYGGRGGADARSVRHHKRDLQHFKIRQSAGEKEVVLAEEPRSKRPG